MYEHTVNSGWLSNNIDFLSHSAKLSALLNVIGQFILQHWFH